MVPFEGSERLELHELTIGIPGATRNLQFETTERGIAETGEAVGGEAVRLAEDYAERG